MAWRTATLALSTLFLASACASFSDLPALPKYDGPTSPLDVQLSADDEAHLEIARDDWRDMPTTGGLSVSATQAIWNSGWVTPSASSDLRLNVRVVSYQSQGPGLLSILTAFVVPGIIDHRVLLDATLFASTGSELRCSRVVEMRTWYQTLLIFVYPFRSPAYGRMKATEMLALQCLSDLLQRAGYGGD